MKTCTVAGCQRKHWARGYCAPHYGTWHRAQLKYHITCDECGREADVQGPRIRHCSQTCSSAVGSRASAAQQAAQSLQRRALVPFVGTPGPKHQPPPMVEVHTSHRLTSGRCRVCDQWFVSFETGVTCSPECHRLRLRQQRLLARDRRRALKRGAYVEDVWRKQVFERDGYRCHLCRKKTRPDKSVPHPRAPTIDHVVPLAAGGTHEPLNCRTSCFICNAKKGDRGGGEQLLLIA